MTRRRTLVQRLKGGLLKTAVMAIGLPSRIYLPYLLLGLWNRIFGGWYSIYYCYAGSRNYIDTYALSFLVEAFRWFPVPIAVMRHDGRLGLVIASPVSEAEFLAPENRPDFVRLQRRIRRIARIVGAERISLTGILPGVVGRDSVLQAHDNRQIVQRAVCAAAQELVSERFGGSWPAVILIGGAGYIGAPIARALDARGVSVHVIDPRSGESKMPESLRGQPCLVVDCSRKGVVEGYVQQMWAGVVLLNEVFPRTPSRLVGALAEKGIEGWHLSGLVGSITPPLPYGYEGAVPCCAAHAASETPDVVLVRMTPERAEVQAPKSAPSECSLKLVDTRLGS